jgi:hypothetical protein
MVVAETNKRVFVIVGEEGEQDTGVYVCRRVHSSAVSKSDLLTGLRYTPGV